MIFFCFPILKQWEMHENKGFLHLIAFNTTYIDVSTNFIDLVGQNGPSNAIYIGFHTSALATDDSPAAFWAPI